MTFDQIGPHPWIGPDYQKMRFDTRLLIVGESHYGSADEVTDRDITNRVVQDRSDFLHHAPFFGIVEQIILGRRPLIAEVKRFWEKTCFVNYAPNLVTEGISSHDRHFEGAAIRLKHIIEETEPDLVCFFSARAWHRRPWGGPEWNEEVFGSTPRGLSDSATLYPFRNRAIVMGRFNHPRQLGAPMDVWHAWYQRLDAFVTEVKSGALR